MKRNEQQNVQKPIIQSSGYNGSEPTRVCPKCGQEKPISDFGFRNMGARQGIKYGINLIAKIADNRGII